MISVTILDYDVSQYIVGNSFELIRAKSEPGQVLINAMPSLQGIDIDGFFNPLNPASIFYGVNDLSIYPVKIYQYDVLIFDGFLQKIERNADRTVSLSLQTELQKTLDRNIIYNSGDTPVTPVDIFIEVCELYNIDYDTVSCNMSRAVYQLNGVQVTASILEPTVTLLAFFEQLSQIGIASIYSIGNKLYYDIQETAEQLPVLTLSNGYEQSSYYILSPPIITSLQKQFIAGYAVTYYDPLLSKTDLTQSFGDQQNAFALSGGLNDPITIRSLQSAVWLGEQWLEYLTLTENLITMDIRTPIARELKIGYPIRLDMQDGTEPRNYIIQELSTTNGVQSRLRGKTNAIY